MKTPGNNQSGFTVIEAIIVVCILAIIGFAGYFVTQHMHKKSTPVVSKSSQSPSSDWKTYTDSTYHFSLAYPSSWNILVSDANPPNPITGQTFPIQRTVFIRSTA